MIIIFLLTSSTGVCYHVIRKDSQLITRIPEIIERERQRRIQLGLEPIFTTIHSQENVKN